MKKSYHNTNGLQGKDLVKAETKAKSQEEKVLEIFKQNKSLSASQAWDRYIDLEIRQTPLTSIRRAITNLCKSGKLKKSELMVTGIYDKPEYIYRLVNRENKQVSIFDIEGV